MTSPSLSFGSVAAAYERFRPGYPDELVDMVLAYAGRPTRTALEIGAGTGKATRAFAARGIVVTATEPDPAMLAELRKHVPPTVVTVQAAFEDLPLEPAYDLVYAAASLHWTDPDQRWERVGAMLTDGGVFACLGGPMYLADPDLEDAVTAIASEFLVADEVVPTDTNTRMRWPGNELIESDLFTDVRQCEIERRVRMPALDYIGHLSTISAYLALPEDARTAVLDRILGVLPEQVTLIADLTVHLARKM